MLDPAKCDPDLLLLPDTVVTRLLRQSSSLQPEDVMIVGAHCRDILRSASGQDSGLRTTEDVDFGLALADWAAFDELTKELEPAGNTGIRYQVADVPTDLIPFGDLEDPSGTIRPARREPINVWGFSEVFQTSRPLPLPHAGTIRIPSIAGYAALKLVAWLDRSAWGAYKDASDIATVLHWYSELPEIAARLWDTDHGVDILVEEKSVYPVAAARVLGQDIAEAIGSARLAELAARWPGPRADSLYAEMNMTNTFLWPRAVEDRKLRVQAMERGLGITSVA
ncbi:hypothetical protein AB0C29_06985 [Actinoplanes sp. NPDC048791]|uniref:hypothetical protein n=1 Tax=Actinoplanes sp. NPDC048791 TaxID=3154623 RepID=UPI0033C2D2C8